MKQRQIEIEMVPTVDARDLPEEVEAYCFEQEFSTHYECAIHQLELDGNPLQKFFEQHGVKFPMDEDFVHIGIIGT